MAKKKPEPKPELIRPDWDMRKCDCPGPGAMAIEYHGMDPYHYDGVSEWQCESCNKRWGRWSGKELKGKEQEPPYGDKSYIAKLRRSK